MYFISQEMEQALACPSATCSSQRAPSASQICEAMGLSAGPRARTVGSWGGGWRRGGKPAGVLYLGVIAMRILTAIGALTQSTENGILRKRSRYREKSFLFIIQVATCLEACTLTI